MIRKFLCLVFFMAYTAIGFSQLQVADLKTENLLNPTGLDVVHPRFSWKLQSAKRNVMQQAYEIKVSLGKTIVWHSGKVSSDQSLYVPFGGSPLLSNMKYTWQVKVWDNYNNSSSWSQPAFFQMALLNKNDWKAKWIEPGFVEDSVMRPSPMFRKEFVTGKKIINATAYITSHGLYEARINGQKIGDAYLTPGWTSYHKRLQYQVYNVTDLLKNGNNAVGVVLASGWYRGIIGFGANINIYGKDVALLFQMIITYNDGSVQIVASDETWKSSVGEISYAEIYNGETIDARKSAPGWDLPAYDTKNWSGVKVADFGYDNLIATCNEPVKKHETFKPVHIFTTPKGEQVIDFGQNITGWVMMKLKGNKGDSVIVSHAEVLDKYGNFYTANLRAAKAQDIYILKDDKDEMFEPHFTWHGFRYIRLQGIRGNINPENFTAVALYSNMQPTGTFTCSNTLINQLQRNIQWGQKGNFLDVPTDCPQRDERLGWTGDAQAFSRTATFNMDVHNFFTKWLKDVSADQEQGVMPYVIPNVLGYVNNSAGWADAATIIPWNIYLAYGDKQILKNQYASMKAYVESIRKVAVNDLWNTGFHFGDWLFYRPEDDNDGRSAVTNKYLIAQCFYAHSTQLLINAAQLLGKTEDVNIYKDLLQKIKSAYMKEYVTPGGALVSGTQTAYVLALNFDMLPDSLRPQAAKRLADNVENYDNHLTTGFLGTPYLCHVLTRFGYDSIAYKLLLQDTYPSWLYPVKMGATTIWERWDGIKTDSTFETPGMNSFNHYAYGAIGDWMYREMAGIDTYEDAPGYKHIKIEPHIGKGFSYASATLETNYGKLSNSWKNDSMAITMDVEIPANTSATIYFPAANEKDIYESSKAISAVKDCKIIGSSQGYVVAEAGSGIYHFTIHKE